GVGSGLAKYSHLWQRSDALGNGRTKASLPNCRYDLPIRGHVSDCFLTVFAYTEHRHASCAWASLAHFEGAGTDRNLCVCKPHAGRRLQTTETRARIRLAEGLDSATTSPAIHGRAVDARGRACRSGDGERHLGDRRWLSKPPPRMTSWMRRKVCFRMLLLCIGLRVAENMSRRRDAGGQICDSPRPF